MFLVGSGGRASRHVSLTQNGQRREICLLKWAGELGKISIVGVVCLELMKEEGTCIEKS